MKPAIITFFVALAIGAIVIVATTHRGGVDASPAPAVTSAIVTATPADAQTDAALPAATPSSDPVPAQTGAPVAVHIAPQNSATPTPSIAFCDVQLDVAGDAPRYALLAVKSDTSRLVLQPGDSIDGHAITALDSDGQVAYLDDGHAIHANQQALCAQYSPLQTAQPCPQSTTDSAGMGAYVGSWRWAPALGHFDSCWVAKTPSPAEFSGGGFNSDSHLQGADPGSPQAAELVRHHRVEDAIEKHNLAIEALQKQTWVWDAQ